MQQNTTLSLVTLVVLAVGSTAVVFRVLRKESPKFPKTSAVAPQTGNTQRFVLVPVMFATDRVRSERMYGSEVSDLMSYGTAVVTIPPTHKTGVLERPFKVLWVELPEKAEKHVIIKEINPMDHERFAREVSTRISQSQSKDAVVFIHGYNVAFEEALRRTAQLAYDLSFVGVPILYSWPSKAAPELYPQDLATIDVTVPHLKSFLMELARAPGVEKVHLIAHSMGALALGRAIRELASDERLTSMHPLFQQIILAAPDINVRTFGDLARAMKSTSIRTTVYESSFDHALMLSKLFNGFRRVGDSRPAPSAFADVDSIDASTVDTGFIGHSYFGDDRPVLTDIDLLLRNNLAPDVRPTLARCGERIWMFRR